MLTIIKRTIKRVMASVITRTLGDECGLVVLPTLSGPARGLRFKLNLKAFIEPLYFLGTYEKNEVKTVANLCKEGWVVWDCGIYLGYYTNLFARLVGASGKVIAFEPDPGNIERTKENLLRNSFSNVQFVNAAIGAPVGEIDFVISHDTNSHIAGAYIGKDYQDYATRERRDDWIRVCSMSLDEAYSSETIPKPNLIKIDIEGAEVDALPNAHRIATELRPLMILELHNPECDAAAWAFAHSVGYELQSLDTGKLITRKEDVTGTLLCFPRGDSFLNSQAL
jgi:FkbM family methyltransferase